jgi:ectoine hydroxylase-related dioxygenase (phytanoyl-CoA dioxygenase family)
MNTNIDKFNELGYLVIENVFSKEEIEVFNEEVRTFVKENPTMSNASGISIPDFIIHQNYFEKTKLMKDNEKLHSVLKNVFADNDYRFCSHNDIGINRIVGWHKDKLNGQYAKYELVDIWDEKDGEKHEIVKVLTYLEDHSNNNDGLKLVPGSHTVKEINSSGWIQLNPKVGDVIIFDQRITHRGMERQVPGSRVLVSFGFGKNNVFTNNFEKGTQMRQKHQNNSIQFKSKK